MVTEPRMRAQTALPSQPWTPSWPTSAPWAWLKCGPWTAALLLLGTAPCCMSPAHVLLSRSLVCVLIDIQIPLLRCCVFSGAECSTEHPAATTAAASAATADFAWTGPGLFWGVRGSCRPAEHPGESPGWRLLSDAGPIGRDGQPGHASKPATTARAAAQVMLWAHLGFYCWSKLV